MSRPLSLRPENVPAFPVSVHDDKVSVCPACQRRVHATPTPQINHWLREHATLAVTPEGMAEAYRLAAQPV